MAKTVNKAILIGYLADAAEARQTNNGTSVANFTVTTESSVPDGNGGYQNVPEYHRCVAFGKLADIINSYTHKGAKVYVEGALRTRKWQDNNGVDRYTTEVVVADISLMTSQGGNGGNQNQGNGNGGNQPRNQNQGNGGNQNRGNGNGGNQPRNQSQSNGGNQNRGNGGGGNQPRNQHQGNGGNQGGNGGYQNQGGGVPPQAPDFTDDIPF